MLKVALTGGIASGKSTVSRLFQARGAPLIDTDLIARELVAPGQPALARIVEHFGPRILLDDGGLDRRRLRRIIFSAPEEKAALERILHPAIRASVETRLADLDAAYVLIAIPLLAESQHSWPHDRVLLVDAPRRAQIERLQGRDHCSEQEAITAINNQATRAQRQAIADDIILNDGAIEKLAPQVEALDRRYRALATD
jgi:dephospho-CoA kinase